MRLIRRFACLGLLLALNEFSALAFDAPAITPSADDHTSIVAAHPGARLPFVGESGVTLEFAAFGSSRTTRQLPRVLCEPVAHGARDAHARRALCQARIAIDEFLSFAPTLVLIRTGALSSVSTTKPPPLA